MTAIRRIPQPPQALKHFRRTAGPVVLLTNAPRSPIRGRRPIRANTACRRIATTPSSLRAGRPRDDLARRSRRRRLPLYYLARSATPGRVRGLGRRPHRHGGRPRLALSAPGLRRRSDRNAGRLCRYAGGDEGAGPDHDLRQSRPGGAARRRSLSIAPARWRKDYEEIGGEVIYYGKPHLPIYDALWRQRRAAMARRRKNRWPSATACTPTSGRQRAPGSMRCSSPTACMARKSSLIRRPSGPIVRRRGRRRRVRAS